MNANELADKLLQNNAVSWGKCTPEEHDIAVWTNEQAASMLRQQQAEIEALKKELRREMDPDEFAQNSINHLVKQNTTRDLAEAIAICISMLKNKEGKLLRVKLTDDYEEHIDFCTQIASMLRKAQEK